MGIGDNLMASGLARGAKARGKRIAFGDGKQILWDHHSEQIFRGNPNIAPLGSEGARDLEWVPFYRGNRIYNRQSGDRWVWNYGFKAIPGEVFLTEDEKKLAAFHGSGYVVIEPNVPEFKTVAPNKQWPVERYNRVAQLLMKSGIDVIQFNFKAGHIIPGVRQIKTPTFRHAMAVLKNAALYIGPEGGLHHASGAVGIPAVVIFGGFIPPAVTGYATHTNLTGGAEACGSLHACEHCREAMNAISVPDVMDAANGYLKVAA
jgi:ADP-heptose:LPS heptosyltransferase